MTIRDFLAALRTRWRIIVVTALLVVAVTAVITVRTQPVYETSTRVYLLASNEDDSANIYTMPSAELDTILEVATSPIVMDRVRESLELPPGTMLEVNANQSGGTPLLDVSVRAHDPEIAQQTAVAVPEQLAAVARNFSPMLASSGQTVLVETIVPAPVPDTPVEPDVRSNLVMGLLAGTFLGIAFAVGRQALDQRIRDPSDVTNLSDRPVVASIPLRKDGDPHTIYLEIDPFGPQAEAVRQLRTNIMFIDVTTGKRSFVISSSLPGEGKTTTAINLALAMSDAGSKVLLIDADLRHPSVATNLGLEGGVGLTTVLLGEAEVGDVIQRWGGTDLHVLASGEIPPNPSELLGSSKMRDLFEQLSQTFDFILIDTPPVLPVTDAIVIERLTGGLLMVVSAGETRKRHLSDALRGLETTDTFIAGFVVTKASPQPSSYYSYYSNPASKPAGVASRRRKRGRRRRSGRHAKMRKAQPYAAAAALERQRRARPDTEQTETDARGKERLERGT